MVLLDVLLGVPPELVVVVPSDDTATHTRDLFHAPIVRRRKMRRELDERFAKQPAATLASNQRKEQCHVMPTFAVIAEHPPNLCPTSNAQTRQMLKQGAGQIPQLAEQLGVQIGTLRIFGPEHIILLVVEADDIESVRNFALQSRLMQWNTVKINATYSIEEAVAMIDEVEAIF
jgi:hypothetical protein